jgi:hypothetical protein
MKVLLGFTIVASIWVLSSCQITYIPSAPIVFNHEQEGDLSVDFKQGLLSSNLQGGYAITDNVNIGASISSLYTGDVVVNSTLYEGTNAYDLSLVAGYYTKLNANTLFELNAGGGAIFINNPDIQSYNKAYLQPSIGFQSKSKGTVFNLGVRTLGTSLYFSNTNTDTIYYNGYAEPFMSLTTGKKIHFLMQAGLSIPIMDNQVMDASPFIFNIGIGYSLGTKRKDDANADQIK